MHAAIVHAYTGYTSLNLHSTRNMTEDIITTQQKKLAWILNELHSRHPNELSIIEVDKEASNVGIFSVRLKDSR